MSAMSITLEEDFLRECMTVRVTVEPKEGMAVAPKEGMAQRWRPTSEVRSAKDEDMMNAEEITIY